LTQARPSVQAFAVGRRALGQGLVALAVAAATAVVAIPGEAGPPGKWTRITATTGRNIDDLGLARTSDGVLHVAWIRQNGTKEDLVHTSIRPDGSVLAAANTIETGWAAIGNPDLIVLPNVSLRVFFGGIRGLSPTDSNSGMNTSAGNAAGTSWSLKPGRAAADNSAYASPAGAGLTSGGTPISTWAVSFRLGVHFGIDPTTPDQIYQTSCCAYQPDVAWDAGSGENVLGWYSNATDDSGLFTQTISPATGARQFVPGSATAGKKSSLSIDQRMAITGRLGAAGVYIAYGVGYPTFRTVNLWRHGSSKSKVVAKANGARFVNIAAAPEGRLWVMWMRSNRLYATRSNRAATKFGPIAVLRPPAGTSSIWKLKGEGSPGPLDLFTSVTTRSAGLAFWHQQVRPPLTLSAKPAKLSAKTGGTVTFAVTDVGDPVSGATVSVGKKSLTTNAKGKATLKIAKNSKRGTLAVSAKKAGYRPAFAKVAVR
jgi:hypothetical protein